MNIPSLAKLFKVKMSWVYRQQKLHVENQIKDIKESIDRLLDILYKIKDSEVWFAQDQLEERNKKLNQLEKHKGFLNKMISNHRAEEQGQPVPNPIVSYDIQQIKKVPIDRLVKVNGAGFFINNPFRKERSPSNSLHWDKKTNRWCDYGSGEYGDVIDLYMKLNSCKLPEALRDLSLM